MNQFSLQHTSIPLLFILSLFLSLPLLAADDMGQQEVVTAAQHANFANQAIDVGNTHLHLHHVINCLAGPDSSDFDASAGNPCKGEGNGALNAMNLPMQEKQTLQQALQLAKLGIEVNNDKAAKDIAKAVRELLESATTDQGM